jgi:hypothetical protein
MMEPIDYYSDRKYCPQCATYVPFLRSVEHSYCATCGSRVRLFSQADWEAFNEALARQRPKGGRPRKERNKESA